MTSPLRPILVCMSWRGGERLARCLASIERSAHHFERIVISVTAAEDSDDMVQARAAQAREPRIEVICTGRELPTMQHQAFWIGYLLATGAKRSDWIYWLAYDDEVRLRGIDSLVDADGTWPLERGTCYFGPWALRHEQADSLWHGDPQEPLESWTSFPAEGPTHLPVPVWIADQLRQPTYMQMSGSVASFGSFIDLRDKHPRKKGPMRIEMAVASAPDNEVVAEFPEPISIIYGRSNSDRAAYGKAARREDLHLLTWLARYGARHPNAIRPLAGGFGSVATTYVEAISKRTGLPQEEWRVRGTVRP